MSADVIMVGMRTLLMLMFSSCFCASSLDIRRPPSIFDLPVESKIYRSEDEITLTCVASGFPKPEYEWLKNGATLNVPGVMGNIHSTPVGTIQISPLLSLDAGVYQCVASNQFGKALSPPTVLQQAVMSSDSGSSQTFETPPVGIGQPLTIERQSIKSFPKPTYTWVLVKSRVSSEQAVMIDLNRRVQTDENGNLHFAYVLPEDAQGGKLYKCNLFNAHSDVTMGGSYTKVNLLPGGELQPLGPTLKFASESPVALEGKNISLRCFFSGYPEPSITWSSERGTRLTGRFQLLNYNTELLIMNVVQSDEGNYICRAGTESHTIPLAVHAVPVFRFPKDKPHDVNVTDGEDVTVVCNAYADPPATVTWFINGGKIDKENLPQRLRISPNTTHLTLLEVHRDYPDGSSDIKVIQCNASNTLGSVYGNGYINVLKKTEMTVVPVDTTVSAAISFAILNCSGISDDSTPVSIKWYKLRDDDSGYSPVIEIPGQVTVEQTGSLSFQLPDNKTSWAAHAGKYRCSVSNGYSTRTEEASLLFEEEETPVIIVTSSAGIPWWIWLIVLLVILFLLLLLLLICCCCYWHRNKGETYQVDEKERKNGHNPEKELADSGFQDYFRPDNMTAGSKASLASTRKTISDDEMSLNEYGDIDAGKFTEDGSFIGDYGNRAYV